MAIARALVNKPLVLICDEVTSALDVLVQVTIIELLIDLQRDFGMAMLFVTGNLPPVRSIAQRVAATADGSCTPTCRTAKRRPASSSHTVSSQMHLAATRPWSTVSGSPSRFAGMPPMRLNCWQRYRSGTDSTTIPTTFAGALR